jgi:Zn-dependent M28 family amino/carboxypeptidase
MAFCGEEMGLIGSAHYANNPIFPLDKMTCLLQVDMVGRNEESQNDKPEDNIDTIHLVGSKRLSMELHQAVLDANKYVNFKFEWDEEDVYTRSDHYNFAAKGVPIAFVFSGFHPDYHQPTDTMDKINFDKIVSTARLFYATALDAANRPAKLKKDASSSGGG